jgi:hypothetical protein
MAILPETIAALPASGRRFEEKDAGHVEHSNRI